MSYFEAFSFPANNSGRFGANPSRRGTIPSRFEPLPSTPETLTARLELLSRLLVLFSGRHGNSSGLLASNPARFDNNPKLPANEYSVPELLPNLLGAISGMLDADLAALYRIPTKALKQAVKRNIDRFPSDFMFELTEEEKNEVVTNCDHLAKLKFSSYLPYAFTEHGALMLANVLNSRKAVQASVQIVRTFIRLRELLATHKDLARKLEEMEMCKISQNAKLDSGSKNRKLCMHPGENITKKKEIVTDEVKVYCMF
jgi:phage regulator Rha-like protein